MVGNKQKGAMKFTLILLFICLSVLTAGSDITKVTSQGEKERELATSSNEEGVECSPIEVRNIFALNRFFRKLIILSSQYFQSFLYRCILIVEGF